MLALVQARLSSKRLPGKVLRPLAGRPLLTHLIERLVETRALSSVVVATSDQVDDDPIAELCARGGVRCYRGPLDDVAERLARAAEWMGAEAFVRICGDSPLTDPALIDAVVELYRSADIELATNVQVRTFPKGLSVEAVRVAALRRAQRMMEPGEAEHVTQVFYRRPEEFRIANLTSGHDWGSVQMSIDTAQDFALAERMFAAMDGSSARYGLRELLALRERCLADVVP